MNIQQAKNPAPTEISAPYKILAGDVSLGVLILCDHATAHLPDHYGSLGLPDSAFERHIAYDIGVEALSYRLNEQLNCPAVLSQFSRLLIDPNRAEDDPTLIMKLSDGQPVPGNLNLSEAERHARLDQYYHPYHDAIKTQIDDALNAGKPPVLLSIHSFTPRWRGVERPWEGGILWDNDPRFALPFLQNLQKVSGLRVGDNEPYSGRLKGDCMYRHGTRRGLAHCLLEIRQDLLSSEAGVEEW